MKVLFLLIFINLNFLCHAQEPVLLLNKLKNAASDTQKINTLNALTKLYINRDLDSASLFNKQSMAIASLKANEAFKYKSIYYQAYIKRKQKQYDEALLIAKMALETALKTKNTDDEANALVLIGTIYEQSNRNDAALENFLKALELSKSTGNKKEMLSAHLSLGIYYKKMTKTTAALTNLLEAMKIAEAIPDSGSMFTTCINLGSLYEKASDNAKAKEFYRKALIINLAEKDENDQAIVFYKLGKLFHKLKQIDSARYYLMATLNIHVKRHDELGLIFDYSNLAGFNMEDGNYSLAKRNYEKALDLAIKHNDTIKINMIYSYLGTLYTAMKDYPNALKNFKTSLIYINPMVPKETIMQQYKKISDIYQQMGNYKEAYLNHVNYKAWSDSSYNVIDTKKQTELKLNYEFEQTQKRVEAETKARELISKAELENERTQRNYLLIGLAVLSLMLVVTVKSYTAKQKANHILQKQKKEIERQKKLVEEKNLEINDSIHYAQRIQEASIPKMSELNAYFKNYALFYKPKDVVSGDFYWAAKMNDYSLIAVADCTGHGVPGAITSMIGSMLLNEIFYVKKLFRPNEVLTELNRLVKLTLRQDSDTLSNDGMDIAFCLLNTGTNELYYAGANRPLYVINAEGLTQYKASKVSVGGQVPLIQDYELHKIQLRTGDTVIASTDGYADQFGGDKEKKFTSKAFRSLLEANYSATPAEQKQIIEKTHLDWKNGYEQTDDILVFILKV